MPEATYEPKFRDEWSTTEGSTTQISIGSVLKVGGDDGADKGSSADWWDASFVLFRNLDIPARARIRKAQFEITAASTNATVRTVRLHLAQRDGIWEHDKYLGLITSAWWHMSDMGAGLLEGPSGAVGASGNAAVPVYGPDTEVLSDSTSQIDPRVGSLLKCTASGTLTNVGVSMIAVLSSESASISIREVTSTLPLSDPWDRLEVGPVLSTSDTIASTSWTNDPHTSFTLDTPVAVTSGTTYAIEVHRTAGADPGDGVMFIYTTALFADETHSDGLGYFVGPSRINPTAGGAAYYNYYNDGPVPSPIAGDDNVEISANIFATVGALAFSSGTTSGTAYSWGDAAYSPTVTVDFSGAIQSWVDDTNYVRGQNLLLALNTLSDTDDDPYQFHPKFIANGTETGFSPELKICYGMWVPPVTGTAGDWDAEDTLAVGSTWSAEDNLAVGSAWIEEDIDNSLGGDPGDICIDPGLICIDPGLICSGAEWDAEDTDPSSTWTAEDTDPEDCY